MSKAISSLIGILLLCLAAVPAWAQAQTDMLPPLPNVIDVRVSDTTERARLIIDLAAKTEFAFVSLEEPARLAIDVRAGTFSVPDPAGQPSGTGIIKAYTVEQAAPDRVRTTLELGGPAQVQQAYVLDAFEDQPARLVVDIIPATAAEFAANVERDKAASADVAAVPAQSTPAGGSELVTESRPLVVIDPGHGGIDSGAESPDGVREKDIVLAFSLKLQQLLMASGRFDVALTREDDRYLKLEERVALARANKADLFLSIHADSFQQPEIRGASVYTRDENATDVLDKVLADSENKSDVIAGFTMPQMAPEVIDILLDLMRREMRVQSFEAAQSIVHQLEPSIALRRFPVRQADFFVLQAPDVPLRSDRAGLPLQCRGHRQPRRRGLAGSHRGSYCTGCLHLFRRAGDAAMSRGQRAGRAEVMPRDLRVCYDSGLPALDPPTTTAGPICFVF